MLASVGMAHGCPQRQGNIEEPLTPSASNLGGGGGGCLFIILYHLIHFIFSGKKLDVLP